MSEELVVHELTIGPYFKVSSGSCIPVLGGKIFQLAGAQELLVIDVSSNGVGTDRFSVLGEH